MFVKVVGGQPFTEKSGLRARFVVVVILSFGAAITGFLAILALIPDVNFHSNSTVAAGVNVVFGASASDDGLHMRTWLPGGFWPQGLNRGGRAGSFALDIVSHRRGGGLSLSFVTPWWALFLVLICFPAWVYGFARRQRLVDCRRRERNECTNCGYSREGNASGVCPECGESLGSP